jgi:hypothetical protein
VSARIVERDAETRRIYESTLDGLTGPFWSFVYGKEVFLTWARSPEEVFHFHMMMMEALSAHTF